MISRIGAWQVDLINNKVTWSKMVNIIHELPPDYVPQSYIECFIHFKEGEDRDLMYHLANTAIKKGTPWDVEIRMVTSQGKHIWIRSKGKTEFVNGKCTRLFGICQDINTRKIAELNYTDTNNRAKRATEASNVGIWEFDTEKPSTIWDDMCYKIHEIDPKKHPNPYKAWKQRVHPEDFERVMREAYSLSKGKKGGTINLRIKLPDNRIKHLQSIATFVSVNKSGNYKAFGIVTDVTKQKITEKKLVEFAEITKVQNHSLRNFAHMVSHDLRSHSSNLSMVTDFLINEKDNSEKIKLFEMLKDATTSLTNTVHNLNEVVQSSANVSDQLIPISLISTIQSVKKNIGAIILGEKINFVLSIADNHKVMGIPAYIDSIFLNLFTNSIKYSEPKRPLTIEINTIKKESEIILTFKDNGKGIDLHKYGGKIFGMHKTFHRNTDARGVGLYITKNQIEAMGGSISVQSNLNIGSIFTLTFKSL